MTARLAALRRNLDVMPSPVPDRPGVLIRDPLGYTDQVLIVPPGLAPTLACFDGESTELDLRERLVRLTGSIEVSALLEHLVSVLEDGGFLDGEVYDRLRSERERAFAAADARLAAHAGSAYPDRADALRDAVRDWLGGSAVAPTSGTSPRPADAPGSHAEPAGIAAPHVSPEGGVRAYRAAYAALGPATADRTFVILGTSHYGEPETFGLTSKPFRTPLGEAPVDRDRMERLAAAGPAVRREDYCHAVEHSIEFQVVFLQGRFGPRVRILPVLCGPFAKRTLGPGRPEDDPEVARFLEALAGLAQDGPALSWVLGIDLAHVGRRYGDAFEARVGAPALRQVEERDRERLAAVGAGDAAGLWRLVQHEADDLRWCGASPLYAFVHAVGGRGHVLCYDQWNIDEASVVSFAALELSR